MLYYRHHVIDFIEVFKIKKIIIGIGMILGLTFSSALCAAFKICLTGKIELMLPSYKADFLNAVDLAMSQVAESNVILRSYFYDNQPLAPARAYDKMLVENCSAIVGFEYLSDLLLITKLQKDSKIPIFTSYASVNEEDELPDNIFMLAPNYNYLVKKMIGYLNKKIGVINHALIITEVDRIDLVKYKKAYEDILRKQNSDIDSFDFIGSDSQFIEKLKAYIHNKKYNFVFVLSGAVGSTKILNYMNDHKIIFIGTENFGSSTNQSLYLRLNDKKINALVIRNIDFFKKNKKMYTFQELYINKYSIAPNILSAYTYDAISIILKTINKYNSITPGEIVKIQYDGITGASIKDGKFYRSAEYIIMSISKDGFVRVK